MKMCYLGDYMPYAVIKRALASLPAVDMPDGYLCEDEEIERALQLLAQALDIAAAGATPEERVFFMKHKRLFNTWKKFQAVSPDMDFAAWCRQSGVCLP